MNADKRSQMSDLTGLVIASAYEVSNVLGVGFLEKVYRRAMLHELRQCGLRVEEEKRLVVHYKGAVVGDYYADLLVEDVLLLELKCVSAFAPEHMAQTLNYLRATDLRRALLLNFQKPHVEVKRVANGL